MCLFSHFCLQGKTVKQLWNLFIHHAGRKKLENQKLTSIFIFNFELKIKWTNDPRTTKVHAFPGSIIFLILTVENKSCVFIFSYLSTGVNVKKSYETCLSIFQEKRNWKIKNWYQFSIFVFELKVKWTNDPRTKIPLSGQSAPKSLVFTKECLYPVLVCAHWN